MGDMPEPSPTIESAPYEVVSTFHGDFNFIHSVTLGDALIALSVLLLLVFLVVKWLLESVWRGGGR